VGKLEGKRPLGRPRRTWVDNTKLDLRKIVTSEDNTTSYWREQQQGANYRLQKKQNNGLTNMKSKLLQTHVDDAHCVVKEFYEMEDILIEFIMLYGP
jgi:hypothetical protein